MMQWLGLELHLFYFNGVSVWEGGGLKSEDGWGTMLLGLELAGIESGFGHLYATVFI